jgi:hypothetical protein
MRDTFWIGVYPGMSDEMIDRMIGVVREGLLQQNIQIAPTPDRFTRDCFLSREVLESSRIQGYKTGKHLVLIIIMQRPHKEG